MLLPLLIMGQATDIESKLKDYLSHYNADVGIAAQYFTNGETIIVNDDSCYPMQSVYKFPLAMALLHQVDQGRFSFDQEIEVKRSELLPDTWSPLREKYGMKDIRIKLKEIIEYTITFSDNNGCDILFRLLGGTAEVEQYVKNLGVENMNIVATEEEMHADWTIQFSNCSQPYAMLKLLEIFYSGKVLSEKSHKFLWEIMAVKKFGMKRIQGKLPESFVVAHKTGTSGTNDEGIAAATNDAGIVVTPENNAFGIVVYVSNSADEIEVREEIIADVSKMIWEEFSAK